eukprot:365433-Chlamydomonas_euryale.AAC.5
MSQGVQGLLQSGVVMVVVLRRAGCCCPNREAGLTFGDRAGLGWAEPADWCGGRSTDPSTP